jgi:hypothetical protein
MTTKIPIAALNELITCGICNGYYRDAHTIFECMHTFCKSCILTHFYNSNVRGNIECPTCGINLGLLGSLSNKMIYDRDMQAIVDKIFPQFAENDKEEEKKFNKEQGIERSGVHSREFDLDVDHRLAKKAKIDPAAKYLLPPSSAASSSMRAQSGTEGAAATSNADNKDDNGDDAGESSSFDFTVKLEPCGESNGCPPTHVLPFLTKCLCKASLSVKMSKVKRFIHKRLDESLKSSLSVEDIDLYYHGALVGDKFRLAEEKEQVVKDLSQSNAIVILYRKK